MLRMTLLAASLALVTSFSANADNVSDAIAAATAANKAAKATGFEWRDTGKMIKAAKAAAAKGDNAKAITIANAAHTQATLAQIQSRAQSNPKPSFE